MQYIILIISSIYALTYSHRHIINPKLLNRSVNRSVSINSLLLKVKYDVLLENHGENHVGGFLFTVEPHLSNHIVYEEAFVVDEFFRKPLKVTEAEVEGRENIFRYIHLSHGLATRKSVRIEINAVFTRCLKPYPTHITQNDKQYVTVKLSHYFFTPYCTDIQRTHMILPNRNILSYTYNEPVTDSENKIELGPYTGVTPFNESAMMLHFENKHPMVISTNLERTIEISNWGNIAIRHKIELENIGAILKGPFSRLERTRHSSSIGQEDISLDTITALLPDVAKDFFYKDDLGNISTSKFFYKDDAVYLELGLRFPLYGGWKISFAFGYNVPSFKFLYNTDEDYVLKMPLVDDLFEDMVVDHMKLTVILPEGVSDIDLATPYFVERLPNKKYFSYLDVVGRTAVQFEMKNLTQNHIEDFEIYYRFSKVMMVVEPLLLICACFIIITLYLPIRKLYESISLEDGNRILGKKKN